MQVFQIQGKLLNDLMYQGFYTLLWWMNDKIFILHDWGRLWRVWCKHVTIFLFWQPFHTHIKFTIPTPLSFWLDVNCLWDFGDRNKCPHFCSVFKAVNIEGIYITGRYIDTCEISNWWQTAISLLYCLSYRKQIFMSKHLMTFDRVVTLKDSSPFADWLAFLHNDAQVSA